MEEVHKKIQKQNAEDYVANNYRFNQLPYFMNSELKFIERRRPEWKLLKEDSWYRMERDEQTIKLTIRTENVQKW